MSASKPLWHGILLVAGGAIGAGIFALPTAASGAWMLWATLGFIFVWAMTYAAASMQAKVNLVVIHQPNSGLHFNSSFNAIVSYTLGKHWALLNNISISFIMMILMYAYTTAGASILNYTLTSFDMAVNNDQRGWLSLVFALLIAVVVSLGTSTVSRITLLLMVGMSILFVAVSSDLLPNVNLSSLAAPNDTFPYLWAALPVLVTAFACGGLVPSLVRHYPDKKQNVFKSLFWGTFLVLVVYLCWLLFTLGSVERSVYLDISNKGGDLASLVKALTDAGTNENIQVPMTLFSHFAIITSFLSVGLGFLHFLQDKLALNNTIKQRIMATVYCFLPPALASFFFPYGFIYAIGLAGLFVAFSFFVLPSVMAFSIRQKLPEQGLRGPIVTVALFGVMIVLLKCLSLLGLLPSA